MSGSGSGDVPAPTPVAFSNDGESAIKRKSASSSLYPENVPESKLETYFEIPRCLQWIERNGFKKTCLQFPDELLKYSITVATILESKCSTQSQIHILADTTYGSCCIDSKTAAHCSGDSIIHFGSSCLSSGAGGCMAVPVLYIFTQLVVNESDVGKGVDEFWLLYDSDGGSKDGDKDKSMPLILFLYDVTCEGISRKMYDLLLGPALADRLIFSELVLPGADTGDNDAADKFPIINGRRIPISPQNFPNITSIFYVGRNEKTIFNFLLQFPSIPFNIYDPFTQSLITKSSHIFKFILQRNYYIEKIKDVKSVGILIASLAGEDHLKIINQIKNILKESGKKYYIVSIGEITPPKLANFPDIELFVLVSCPESWIWNSKEFYQPIVMPYELEIALNKGREWKGDYIVDYRHLLPGGQKYEPLESILTSENSDVSLITGGLRQASVAGTNSSAEIWQGINDSETTRNPEIHEGKSGIPQHYTSEPI